MKYCLGLDLGVGSIGSAIVELDKENRAKQIVDAGVRIFEVSEGAEERRIKRTMRKNLIRTRKRLELLAKKLCENKLWVDSTPEGTVKLSAKSPYKIRFDAVHEKLANPNYIGRAILHLAKHRGAGFVSANEEMQEEILEEGDKSKRKLSPYEQLDVDLRKESCQTVGEYFYKRIQDKEKRVLRQHDYALKSGIVNYAIPRYLVKDEFNKIWDIQSEYFEQMRKPGLKQEIYDILFYERPSAPYAIGKCIYFRDEDRLLKAHPLSEMRRIYEEVNNIRIANDMNKRKLNMEERDKIIDVLMRGENVGKLKIKKLLALNGQQRVSISDDDKPIKAYLYSRPEFVNIDYIKELNECKLEEFIEFLANPVDVNDKNGRLYSEDALINKLKSILGIYDERQIGKLLTMLPKGRSMLGLSATKIILNKLKEQVVSHRKITDELAKTDVRFMAEEERACLQQGKNPELLYYGQILQTDTQPLPPLVIKNNPNLNSDEVKWGKIANPAVHMILNQIRLVVNEIVKIYGRPYAINLELGRDVGMSTKKKNEHEQQQRANEKLNDEAKAYLKNHRLYVNSTNILKYKLTKEQGWKDAYNPTSNIPQNFDGFEVEHIIPQAKGGTDTYNNLCLVNRNDNLNKGDRFAYEYFAESKTPEQIREILKNVHVRTPNKAWRFEPDAREKYEESGDEEENNRYLTDTRYVSKMAARYLRTIIDCDDSDEVKKNRILAVKGGQTAILRRNWNLLGLEYDLMGINIPRYIDCAPYWVEQKTGVVEEGKNRPDKDGEWRFFDKTKNKEWLAKPRIDHRHHAMDAITVACCTRSLVQKLANVEKINHVKFPLPLTEIESVGEFRRKVIDKLKDVKVSHKPDHSLAGQMHKETGRVVLCQNPDDENSSITVYSRKILQVVKTKKDLNKLLIAETIKGDGTFEIADKIAKDRDKQAKLFDNLGFYMDTAEQILIAENEQDLADGKKEIKITEGRIITKAFKIIQEKGLWHGDKFKCYENNSSLIYIRKHGVAYVGGNNHCVDFYVKDGKIGWEIISRFNANQKAFVPQWKKNGGKIIWSVQQGDMLELDTPDEWKSYTDKPRCLAKVKKFSEGKLSIDYITDARMTSPKDKSLKYMFVDTIYEKGLSYFIKNHARKIELTPFGKVKKKHKVLSNGSTAAA